MGEKLVHLVPQQCALFALGKGEGVAVLGEGLVQVGDPRVFLAQHPSHGFVHEKGLNFALLNRQGHVGIGAVVFLLGVFDKLVRILVEGGTGHHPDMLAPQLAELGDLLGLLFLLPVGAAGQQRCRQHQAEQR